MGNNRMTECSHANVEPPTASRSYGATLKSTSDAGVPTPRRKNRPRRRFNKVPAYAARAARAGRADDETDGPRIPMRRNRWLWWWVALWPLALLSAHAAPPDVPDPVAWAALSPQEQAASRAELKQRLQAATPAERAAFRNLLRERLEAMTPEQRQALAGRTRERWQQLAPDERQRLINERRERVKAMSPEERRQLIQERRDILGKLSPEERAALREKLPAR